MLNNGRRLKMIIGNRLIVSHNLGLYSANYSAEFKLCIIFFSFKRYDLFVIVQNGGGGVDRQTNHSKRLMFT